MKTFEVPRSVYLQFAFDANCINARQADPDLNQLEQWQRDRIINVIMPRGAYDEAKRGGSLQRATKVSTHVCSTTLATTAREHQLLRRIEETLFPEGAQSDSQRNDVPIVFNAQKYNAILVTHDGGSKRQPGGILGSRAC